ncbi:glycosyltransferase [Desulfococcaceae bacterium HSG7]|nr:glycosyltransferase [Desulfococcaceae bacterium HSG7]
MKKLAYIDHSFHIKSTATLFLINILKKYYEVEIFWDEFYSSGLRVDLGKIAAQKFDTLILFQQLDVYTIDELESLNCDNIILIPMYDACFGYSDEYWLVYRNFKFINFSKTLHLKLKKLGIVSVYFQYFLNPVISKQQNQNFTKLNGFFWQRTGDITWNQIKTIVKKTDFNKIHIHTAVDPPGYPIVLPSKHETEKYNVTVSDWFPEKDDYFKLISDTNVFFAPRPHEGIGMSFIEAMTMGQCVVAPDNPTMNEYITHGVNGLLYDPKAPRSLDFSDIETLSVNAKKYMYKGYRKWIKSEKKLIRFIDKPKDTFLWIKIKRKSAKNYLQIKIDLSVKYPKMFSMLTKLKKRYLAY